MVLMAAMLFGAFSPALSVSAYAVTQEDIDELEDEKDKIAENVQLKGGK